MSVIIPCYNQAQFLPDVVSSLLEQTYCDWECIIVNDGSPDHTEEVFLNNWSNDRRFKYVKKENGGLSDARNAGITVASGEFILPLDADDRIGPNYLKEATDILKNNNCIKIVYSNAEFFGDKIGKWELPEFNFKNNLLYNHIFCSGIYRKSDYLKTKGYDTGMKYGWEDWEFWLSLLENGGEVYKINATHFYYRVRSESMVLSMSDNERISLRKRVYLNHPNMYDNLFSDPISLYQENQNLKKKCTLLENSKYYKLGYLMLFPVRFFYIHVIRFLFCNKNSNVPEF